ncbi:MAG: dienelactone hydrolase family protein [Clostridiales bacterium]|nr:dienelactone hydrolase family protein [Clostridiales bacterium]
MKKINRVLVLLMSLSLMAGCSSSNNSSASSSPETEVAESETTEAETEPAEAEIAEAATEEAESSEIVPAMVTTTQNGSSYSWQPTKLFFTADADRVLIDYFTYMLQYNLETKDEVVFIALDDLETIYSPDFKVERADDKITITHAGVSATITVGSVDAEFYTGAGELEAAPYESGDVVFVPLTDLMVKGFGRIAGDNGVYFGLGTTDDFEVANSDVYNLKMFFRGKGVGKSYWTYWNEEIQRLEPVVVYIPSTYDPTVPNKMIVQLHGASGNATTIPDSDNGVLMMEYAEKYGYIVMWPDVYGSRCNFGMWVQPAGQLPITAETDPDNPGGYSAETLTDIRLSGNNVQIAMDYVESKWTINEDNVFIMGISMGGCGTWYQAAFYGDRFAAASPSGAFVEPAYFDWSRITIPVLYVGGTEDRNGYDLMLNAYDIAMSQNANIQEFITVGGAPHGGEWPKVLEQTYEFFESYCR